MNVIDSLNAQTGMQWTASTTEGYYLCRQGEYRYTIGLTGPGYFFRMEIYENAGWSGVDVGRQSLADAMAAARRMMEAR